MNLSDLARLRLTRWLVCPVKSKARDALPILGMRRRLAQGDVDYVGPGFVYSEDLKMKTDSLLSYADATL